MTAESSGRKTEHMPVSYPPFEKREVVYDVKAQRGDTLRCKGWKQETILRMLENNMEVAEHPERLVIYGGIGKAARNWESYHAIVEALRTWRTTRRWWCSPGCRSRCSRPMTSRPAW
jgi:hypothetical protein